MAVHTVYLKPQNVDSNGNIVDKNDPSTTIAQVMRSNTEMRVIPDQAVPSSLGSPTIQRYLDLEDAAGFRPVTVNNTMIVTQN
jgi:hypothetical protein